MDARGRPRELRTRQKRGSVDLLSPLIPLALLLVPVLINALNLSIDEIISMPGLEYFSFDSSDLFSLFESSFIEMVDFLIL